ncbi:enoyl-CoA hydratase/isomerase family protein [Brevundimonas sp.]|uniref:enoyl-CoA hydratase/isomerase family protein n=1 Tax=Brevundimonas sp. TaxID=1871086 RepID=UPI0028A2D538|nr:enoyl-CoA hydratase/isomerase family protein [Brevundimonas sp.]
MSLNDFSYLTIEHEAGLTTVTLNRPDRRNAAHRPMLQELQAVWPALAADDRTKAVLLTGAGVAFCVGGDINAMGGGHDGFGGGREVRDIGQSLSLVNNMLNFDKPVVCAVNGDAIGLGATLALLCDIVVMAEDARIGDPHVKMGLVAGDGGVLLWPLLVGVNRAKEYLMRGKLLSSAEAERVGLVNYTTAPDRTLPHAREIAMELCEGSPWAIRWTKLSINQILKERANLTGLSALALEHLTMHTADHAEAAAAFKARRKPKFMG